MKKEPLIAREGWGYLAIFIAIDLLCFFFCRYWLALPLLLTAYILWFFRNPVRPVPEDPSVIVAPADGKVVFVGLAEEKTFTKTRMQKISIFMNLFDVHVNRVPLDGTVEKVDYQKGSFVNASFEQASDANERNALLVNNGPFKYVMVQVAGLVARRILCDVKAGDVLKRGARYGIIKFGSRVDVYLPVTFPVSVKIGDKVKGNATPLAKVAL